MSARVAKSPVRNVRLPGVSAGAAGHGLTGLIAFIGLAFIGIFLLGVVFFGSDPALATQDGYQPSVRESLAGNSIDNNSFNDSAEADFSHGSFGAPTFSFEGIFGYSGEQLASPPTLTSTMLSAYVASTRVARLQSPALLQASALAAGILQTDASSDRISKTTLLSYIASDYVPTSARLASFSRERECLAKAIYHEARGEPEEGQWAVATVIINRVNSSRYPDSVCEVVYQNAALRNRCQFSFACDGISDEGGIGNKIVRESWVKANLIARAAFERFVAGKPQGNLPESVLYYHSLSVSPDWASRMKSVARIGQHVFYSLL